MQHRIKYSKSFSLALVLMLLICTVTAFAQTYRGGINGTITDSTGAVVAGASVVATDVATGINYKSVSSSGGEFLFQDLPLVPIRS